MERFTLSSTTFDDDGLIPIECTCEGLDQSPAFAWAGTPGKAQSMVLIVDDPDAPGGTFTHWVLFDIPAETRTLDARRPAVGIDAINDFLEPGYRGPCPPAGDKPHGYRFSLYALEVPSLGLSQSATRREVEGAMQGHILAVAELSGRYERRERSAEA
jgi:hypothetical protein